MDSKNTSNFVVAKLDNQQLVLANDNCVVLYDKTKATKDDGIIPQQTRLKRPKGWGKRHTLAILGFWAFAMSYAMRFNLTIAIVEMAKTQPNPNGDVDPEDLKCEKVQGHDANNLSIISKEGEFEWNPEQQGLILGSFYWGYVMTQLPGGFIATRFGGKWPLAIGLFISGLFTILTPLAARMDIAMLMYVRFVAGLAQGMIFPAMQKILAAWAPPEERSRLSSITYSGCQFGAAMTMITSGYLIESSWGWVAVFYVTGGVTLVWFVFWSYFVSSTPSENSSISQEELNYIQTSLGGQFSEERVPTPWKKIFTSKSVWAIIIAGVGHSWGFFTLANELPTYLKTVLHFDIRQNSWLSAMPEFFMWISSNVITYIADKCISKNYAKVITVRKICQAIADLGSALAVIGATLVHCNRTAAVAFLTLAVAMSGGVHASYFPNQVEIACNHVGIIMGISNTLGNFAGFGTAILAGVITNNHSHQGDWNSVFWIAAGFYIVDVIVYLLFASSDEQSWNRNIQRSEPLEEKQIRSDITDT